jgi:hypothetical protein
MVGGHAEDWTCGDEGGGGMVCIGHQINSKGHVHMVLKWSDVKKRLAGQGVKSYTCGDGEEGLRENMVELL